MIKNVIHNGYLKEDRTNTGTYSIFGNQMRFNLENNTFFYRHTLGIGFRMKSPTPMQVDFGIKLNHAKKFRKNIPLPLLHQYTLSNFLAFQLI